MQMLLSPRREVSEPRPGGMRGAAVCPGGTEDIEVRVRRGVQAHVEVAPCGVSAAKAKMEELTLAAHAQRALFVEVRMSGMLVDCPRREPPKWMAEIA